MTFTEERRQRRYGDSYHIIKCPIPDLREGDLIDYKGRAQRVEKLARRGTKVVIAVGGDEFRYPANEHVWRLVPKCEGR